LVEFVIFMELLFSRICLERRPPCQTFHFELERDEEKWVPVLRSSARSECKNEITVHDFGSSQSKIIVI